MAKKAFIQITEDEKDFHYDIAVQEIGNGEVSNGALVLWVNTGDPDDSQNIVTSPMDEWDAYNLLMTLAEGLRTSENSHYAALGRGICEADHKLHAIRADRVGDIES